ncbi:Arylsulfatase [Paramyrothecium foliicola]|nr:Arylsulfatase [Paramyrothecium foliicola]
MQFGLITGTVLAGIARLAVCALLDEQQVPLAPAGPPPAASKPNIIFILTDDQDLQLNSLAYMPLVKKHLLDHGTFYKRHFCSSAVCCPSRATLWTGKFAHNTNVTDLFPPYGGFPIFVKNGHNENYLPLWLQDAGYNTYYTGKMFNAHTIWNYNSPYLKGWNGSDFLLDPNTYDYWNSTFQRNKEAPINHAGEYSTDLIWEKAVGFLEEATAADRPFFISIAPVAPHSNMKARNIEEKHKPDQKANREPEIMLPKPAKRHEHLFPGAQVPRADNFNPKDLSGANWIKRQPRQSAKNVEYNDQHYRGRLQALQVVDEMVDDLVQRLERQNLLHNTYIFYTSDNGYHIGQHRLQPGKECGYEEDINVPLIVRGPGIPSGLTTELVTAHVDLAPTILSLAQASLRSDLDGSPIPLYKHELEETSRSREHANVEYWGWAGSESPWQYNAGDDTRVWNNTYKSLRIVGNHYNFYYSVWCNNERELYDMRTDPGQLRNLLLHESQDIASQTDILGHPLDKVIARLNSLLLVLKSCKGSTCSQPWRALHPSGDVDTLEAALSPRFDEFYKTQAQVKFDHCEKGYIVESEGPQFEKNGFVYWEPSRWSDWT